MFLTKHYYTRWGALVLILAYLSIGLMPVGQGAVLCRGADGRVEVKGVFDSSGSCPCPMISSERAGLVKSLARSCQEDCCGPCDHTPLGNQEVSASLSAKKRTSLTDGSYCWTKTSPATAFDFIRKHSQGQSSASATLILLTHRTVILLI